MTRFLGARMKLLFANDVGINSGCLPGLVFSLQAAGHKFAPLCAAETGLGEHEMT